MSRTKFGSDAARLSQWLPAGQIDVDPTVQRPLNAAWADKIGRELDPDLIGIIHVSHRTGGRYVVIDGQHRLHAVKHIFGDNGTLVECKVYEGLSRSQEAARFVGLNDVKRPVRIDIFMKNVIAKDPDAVAINAVVQEVGLKVDRYKADKTIPAIAALEDVYYGFEKERTAEAGKPSKQAHPELLRSTLLVIRNAWGGTSDSFHGHIITGIGRLLAARQRAMEVDAMVHKLSIYPGGPTALIGAAKGLAPIHGGLLSGSVAEVCLSLYNKGRRVGALEPLR